MFLCGDVLYIQIKKWYVKFGATGSLSLFCLLVCAILLFTLLIFEKFLSPFIFVSVYLCVHPCTGHMRDSLHGKSKSLSWVTHTDVVSWFRQLHVGLAQ